MTFHAYPTQQVTAGILAGGRGMRMGGRDKGLVLLHGIPLVAHVLEAVQPQADVVLINANRNLERYARFGVPVVPDVHTGYGGPLVGVLSLLRATDTPWLLVVPCDGLRMPSSLGARLWAATRHSGSGAVVRTRDGLQPTFALLHRRLADDLCAYLQGGGTRLRDWVQHCELRHADFRACRDVFCNINTPAQLHYLAASRPAVPSTL